ncbi:MAG: cytidylate kinase family protein [Syntrophobacteraceae bacterium]
MAVITISREPGCLGEEVAARIAGHLGFLLLDKARLAQILDEREPDAQTTAAVGDVAQGHGDALDSEAEAFANSLPDLMAELAEEQDLVVMGRGAQGLFHNRPGTLHVHLVAPRKFRIMHVQTCNRLSAREAGRRIKEIELRRARLLRAQYHLNWADPSLYDLCLRMDRLSIEQAITLIVAAFEEMGLQQVPRSQIVEDLLTGAGKNRGNGRFVNAAEREFAGFLEFYRIPYEYEPRTFTLETDADGRVTEAFTPDFYLPDQDLYIELTTMKQSLVTRKNRKVRKLRQLHPEVNIRIFYQRDFQNLMAKYGLLNAHDH